MSLPDRPFDSADSQTVVEISGEDNDTTRNPHLASAGRESREGEEEGKPQLHENSGGIVLKNNGIVRQTRPVEINNSGVQEMTDMPTIQATQELDSRLNAVQLSATISASEEDNAYTSSSLPVAIPSHGEKASRVVSGTSTPMTARPSGHNSKTMSPMPTSPMKYAAEGDDRAATSFPNEVQSVKPVVQDVGGAEKAEDDDTKSEIQNIMEQFEDGDDQGTKTAYTELAEPALEVAASFPPRRSSLEYLKSAEIAADLPRSDPPLSTSSYFKDLSELQETSKVNSIPKPPSVRSLKYSNPVRFEQADPISPISPVSLNKDLPPEPDPEPDLPFDFHRFLEQLRHSTADPVAKYLRSFLTEFGKKQWMVHEQVKIISDFLSFINNKMAQCEIWRDVSDAEFENAREGMEKLVMNRLYTQTFSPAIPPAPPIPVARGKKKANERPFAEGRRGQHQEDVERDDVLAQKVGIYGWVQEKHLDIHQLGDSGKRFLTLAQQGRLV